MKIGKINSSQDGIIHSVDGISQSLSAGHGNSPKILVNGSGYKIAAMRGRNPNNTSDRTVGAPTEQRLEVNSDSVSNTLTSVQKDNLVIVANTSTGYEEVSEGDSVNFSVLGSKTRRGRVGKGVAQTLDTACNQGVIDNGGKNYLQYLSDKGVDSQQNRIHYEGGNMSTIPSNGTQSKVKVFSGKQIRRLTETECERLQGLPDGHTKYGNYGGVVKEISATQRYKLCGNGVSIPPVQLIAQKLFDLNYNTNGNL